jgi:dephospho-CoA kinase
VIPLKRPGHYLVGLTGNIAVGKSTVLALLRDWGAQAIDADQVAHEVMAQPAVREAIVQAFGSSILRGDGAIDRAALGRIVFLDPEALRRLESIVHPVVRQAIDALIETATTRVVVIEAIKLIEAGLHRGYDALWVVTAPPAQQVARLMATRGLSEDEARLRIDAQPPQDAKVALADVVIDNRGDRNFLERQIRAEWDRIQDRLAQCER